MQSIRYSKSRPTRRRVKSRRLVVEQLESRWLLAIDLGDAPDPGRATGPGNYETTLEDNGPSHIIVEGLFLGHRVDGESNAAPSANADGDDRAGDDEDGVFDPSADLSLTVGTQPKVRLRATNATGADAVLSGWIDYNSDGVFDDARERAQVTIADAASNQIVMLEFPEVPAGSAGETLARFRLSTDSAAQTATGPAADGEVEDYLVRIYEPSEGVVVDQLMIADGVGGLPGRILPRETPHLFGSAVSSLGDIDGDGIGDIAVGVIGLEHASHQTGSVYILRLNANGSVKDYEIIANGMGGLPEGTLEINDQFGAALAPLGDLDGDGITELAVGAPTTGPPFDDGAIYILFLDSRGRAKSVQKIASGIGGLDESVDDRRFGLSITAVGDFSGDGIVDLAVGVSRRLAMLLFMNREGTVQSSHLIGDQTDRYAAEAITSLGDINDDGTTDLAVGLNRQLYVLMMNADGSVKSETRIADGLGGLPIGTLRQHERFANALSSAGDLNGDGVEDVLVGSDYPGWIGATTAVVGTAYVLFLRPDGSAGDVRRVQDGVAGAQAVSGANAAVAVFEDFDGDGVRDMAFGTGQIHRFLRGAGSVHILNFGAVGASRRPNFVVSESVDFPITASVSDNETTVGEEGLEDTLTVVLTVQPDADVAIDLTSSDTTEVVVDPQRLIFTAENWHEPQTVTVRGVRDATDDGDQLRDITLSIDAGDSAAAYRNVADQIILATNRNAILDTVDIHAIFTSRIASNVGGLGELESRTSFGLSVAALGDLDGDGNVDVAVGAPDDDGDTPYSFLQPGTLHVLFLNADGTVKRSVELGGSEIGQDLGGYSRFGSSVTALGDVDGDGVVDLAVGAVGYLGFGNVDCHDEGAVYILFMHRDGSVKSSRKLASNLNGLGTLHNDGCFGYSLARLGDLDGDGVPDLAAGSPEDMTGSRETGSVSILFLNRDGTVKASQKLNANLSSAWNTDFGRTMTAPGDVDGDGITDLAVTGRYRGGQFEGYRGAPLESAHIHILMLNRDGTVKSSRALNGRSLPESFSRVTAERYPFAPEDAEPIVAITSPGDFDGDGVPDLVAGTYGEHYEQGLWGEFYALLLNPDGSVKAYSLIADERIATRYRNFGYSVAAIGDLNRDGLLDLMVGAPYLEGEVYVLNLNAGVVEGGPVEPPATPGFTIHESAGSTVVNESGLTDSFTVVLDAAPDSPVVIDVASDDAGEVSVTPQSLRFTPHDWNVPQEVVVTGVDDVTVDGDQSVTVTLRINTLLSDDAFHDVANQRVLAVNADNDVAAILVHLNSDGLTVSETGTSDTFSISLRAQPTSDVVLLVTSGDTTEVTVDANELTFTPENWDRPRTMSVTGVDDSAVDGPQTSTIEVSVDVASSAEAFRAAERRSIRVTTMDDDVGGFSVVETDGATVVSEDRSTDTILVALDSRPLTAVTIEVHSSDTGEAAAFPALLTFIPDAWNIPQTLTVTGVDDEFADGPQSSSIRLSVQADSSDPAFWGANQVVPVVTLDNDVAGFLLVETEGTTAVSEEGSTDTFTVVLAARPAGSVTIRLQSDDLGEAIVLPTSITFNATNWNVPQVAIVTAVDDLVVDGPQESTITLTIDAEHSDDSIQTAPQTVTVTTADNDVPGITVQSAGLEVQEAGSRGRLSVALAAQPASAVTLAVRVHDETEVAAITDSLLFTPENWDSPQEISIVGVDDRFVDGDQTTAVTIAVDDERSDPLYRVAAARDVSVVTRDDDVAGFAIQPDAVEVSESGSSTSFNIRLTARPVSNVQFDVRSGDFTEVTVSPTTIVFTPENWTLSQSVRLEGVDDEFVDGDQVSTVRVSIDAAHSDSEFASLDDATVSVTTRDNDRLQLVISQTDGFTAVAEGGATDSVTVALSNRPVADVFLRVVSRASAELEIGTDAIAFTPSEWDQSQSISLRAVDDHRVDGDQVVSLVFQLLSSSSADANLLVEEHIQVTLQDNDHASFEIIEPSSPIVVSETGTSASFGVVLGAQPSRDVVLRIESSDTGEAFIGNEALTFTPENWDRPQTVTVTGVDDPEIDGTQSSDIAVMVDGDRSAAEFGNLQNQTIQAITTDDDTADLLIELTDHATVVSENGSMDTFTVVLTARPQSLVTLGVQSSNAGEVIAQPSSLSFTEANWNVPQLIAIIGVNDFAIDGDQESIVSLTVDPHQSDPAFRTVARSVPVITTDDDIPGIVIDRSQITVAESGTTVSIEIALAARPESSVTVNAVVDDRTEFSLSSIFQTFQPDDWYRPKTLTVTGLDDDVVDGDSTTNIRFSVADTTTDEHYRRAGSREVSVTVLDDDVYGLRIFETDGSTTVTEGGATDGVDIQLASRPESEVTVWIVLPNPGRVESLPRSLPFAPAAWNQPQRIDFRAVQNDGFDGDEVITATIELRLGSDATSRLLVEQQLDVTVMDDNRVPVVDNAIVTPTSITLTGGGQTLDLADLAAAEMTTLNTIDIRGLGKNRLRLGAHQVVSVSSATRTLLVRSGAGDTVDIGPGWRLDATQVSGGEFVRVLTQAGATLRLVGPNDWTNPANPRDVNGNGTVEPLDALLIINELAAKRFMSSSGRLMGAAHVTQFPGSFYDVSSDGVVSPQDALIVINFLNATSVGIAAEGESASLPPVDLVMFSAGQVSAQTTTAQATRPVNTLADDSGNERETPQHLPWAAYEAAVQHAVRRVRIDVAIDELMRDDDWFAESWNEA